VFIPVILACLAVDQLAFDGDEAIGYGSIGAAILIFFIMWRMNAIDWPVLGFALIAAAPIIGMRFAGNDYWFGVIAGVVALFILEFMMHMVKKNKKE
jgi:hypothetical protein